MNPDEDKGVTREIEAVTCRALIAPTCERAVQPELADEDSTFDPETGTFVCDPCWQRAMEFAALQGSRAVLELDVDSAVRAVQDHDRRE